MFQAANKHPITQPGNVSIPPYVLGDMTSTVYPVGGGMEDWGYGAGFDTASNAGFHKCTPQTMPILPDSFFESQENVRCAVYLIETDNNKNPSAKTYGGRDIERSDSSGDYQVMKTSIEDRNTFSGFDGHINRNIRLATAMIDMSKPYLYIKKITAKQSN